MRVLKLWVAAICGLSLSAWADPLSTDLVVGQVIGNEVGQVINGWTHLGGGMFVTRKTANYVTTETSDCCFAIFEKGDTTLIAKTTPIARNQKGGVLAERIDQILKVNALPDEVSVGDCSILWVMPAWTLLNERTKLARSYIVTDSGIEQLTWLDEHSNCDLGD